MSGHFIYKLAFNIFFFEDGWSSVMEGAARRRRAWYQANPTVTFAICGVILMFRAWIRVAACSGGCRLFMSCVSGLYIIKSA